jgi:hypothetical protein
MKYIESNIPPTLLVRVTHYHHGNHVDLQNGGAKYVTHAWLEDNHGRRVGEAMAVGHGHTTARSRRTIRRAMAVGRAFKRWHLHSVDHAM